MIAPFCASQSAAAREQRMDSQSVIEAICFGRLSGAYPEAGGVWTDRVLEGVKLRRQVVVALIPG